MSDAANILKSVLARGEVKVIGATTLSEYKKHILEDEALRTALPLRARGIIGSQQGGVPRGLQHRDRAGNSP